MNVHSLAGRSTSIAFSYAKLAQVKRAFVTQPPQNQTRNWQGKQSGLLAAAINFACDD
jgi:hypothetical protein